MKAANRRFTTKMGVIGPSDWYMKEFSRDTMNYFASHKSMKQARQTLTDIQKLEIEEALDEDQFDGTILR